MRKSVKIDIKTNAKRRFTMLKNQGTKDKNMKNRRLTIKPNQRFPELIEESKEEAETSELTSIAESLDISEESEKMKKERDEKAAREEEYMEDRVDVLKDNLNLGKAKKNRGSI